MSTLLASFSFGLESLSNRVQILPGKDFAPVDGRKLPFAAFKINPEIAAKVIARQNTKKNKTLIDYEHQSIRSAQNGQPAPAAGWFKKLSYSEDSGLWAEDVKWNKRAQQYLDDEEYKYTSAVFIYDEETGEVLEIISFALTNTPALDGMQALQELTAQYQQLTHESRGFEMSGKDVATLTAEVGTLTTQVATLTAERDQSNAKVTSLTAELKTATDKIAVIEAAAQKDKEAAETKAREDLITAALSSGKLAPALKDWAETQTVAQLTAYLEKAPTVIDEKLQHDPSNKGKGAVDANGLTPEEVAMCNQMQQDPIEYAKQKKALASL